MSKVLLAGSIIPIHDRQGFSTRGSFFCNGYAYQLSWFIYRSVGGKITVPMVKVYMRYGRSIKMEDISHFPRFSHKCFNFIFIYVMFGKNPTWCRVFLE